MEYLDHYVYADLGKSVISGAVAVRERNTLHRLIVPLTFLGEGVALPTGATATLVYKKPDGTKSSTMEHVSVSGGVVTAALTLAMLDTPGEVEAQIEVYGPDENDEPRKLFSTPKIRLTVEADLYDADAMQEIVDDPTVYEQIVGSFGEWKDYITELQWFVENGYFNGKDGKDGATGPQGPQGIPGPKGDKGDPGSDAAVPTNVSFFVNDAGYLHHSGPALAEITIGSMNQRQEAGETYYQFVVGESDTEWEKDIYPSWGILVQAAEEGNVYVLNDYGDPLLLNFEDGVFSTEEPFLTIHMDSGGTELQIVFASPEDKSNSTFRFLGQGNFYATWEHLNRAVPTKVSELANDAGYLHNVSGDTVEISMLQMSLSSETGLFERTIKDRVGLAEKWADICLSASAGKVFFLLADGTTKVQMEIIENGLSLNNIALGYNVEEQGGDFYPNDPHLPSVCLYLSGSWVTFVSSEDRSDDSLLLEYGDAGYATQAWVLEQGAVLEETVAMSIDALGELVDDVDERLGGLAFKKAYSAYPADPQDGDIVCIDGNYDVYHTGDGWEPMTPDPDTVYFVVDPPSGS